MKSTKTLIVPDEETYSEACSKEILIDQPQKSVEIR